MPCLKAHRPDTEKAAQRISRLALDSLEEVSDFPWSDGCGGDLVALEPSDWNFYIGHDDSFLPSVEEVVNLIVENPQWLRACKLKRSYTNVYIQMAHFCFWKIEPRMDELIEVYARKKYSEREGREYNPETGL